MAGVDSKVKTAPGAAVSGPDIGAILDAGPWSAYQKAALVIIALAVILDGFDNQLLALAIPVMMPEWQVTRDDFKWVLVTGFVGMSVGTALFGMLGDRFGRRPVLIGCILLFALPTMAIATAKDVSILYLFRFFGGLGLGGCMPNATALLAEITPSRSRNIGVTLGIIGIPIGGMLGGLIAANVLPVYGWPVLFLIGGVTPLVVAAVMVFSLPESPQFLARRPTRRADLVKVMRRFSNPADLSGMAIGGEAERPRISLGALFRGPYRTDTPALWIAFFFSLFASYGMLNWLPAILGEAGYASTVTSESLLYFNLGGVAAALGGAWCFNRFGSRVSLIVMAAGAILCSVWLSVVPLDPASGAGMLRVALVSQGAFLNALQTTMYALAAFIYLTEVRSAGVGWAAGVGRVGAMVSPLVWSAVLAGFGPGGFFLGVGLALSVSLVALACIRSHVPPSKTRVSAGVRAAA